MTIPAPGVGKRLSWLKLIQLEYNNEKKNSLVAINILYPAQYFSTAHPKRVCEFI